MRPPAPAGPAAMQQASLIRRATSRLTHCLSGAGAAAGPQSPAVHWQGLRVTLNCRGGPVQLPCRDMRQLVAAAGSGQQWIGGTAGVAMRPRPPRAPPQPPVAAPPVSARLGTVGRRCPAFA